MIRALHRWWNRALHARVTAVAGALLDGPAVSEEVLARIAKLHPSMELRRPHVSQAVRYLIERGHVQTWIDYGPNGTDAPRLHIGLTEPGRAAALRGELCR